MSFYRHNDKLYIVHRTIAISLFTDKEGKVGMPGTIEAGYLFNYENPCCDWFITLSARYTTNNMLRDKDRPHLSISFQNSIIINH